MVYNSDFAIIPFYALTQSERQVKNRVFAFIRHFLVAASSTWLMFLRIERSVILSILAWERPELRTWWPSMGLQQLVQVFKSAKPWKNSYSRWDFRLKKDSFRLTDVVLTNLYVSFLPSPPLIKMNVPKSRILKFKRTSQSINILRIRSKVHSQSISLRRPSDIRPNRLQGQKSKVQIALKFYRL